MYMYIFIFRIVDTIVSIIFVQVSSLISVGKRICDGLYIYTYMYICISFLFLVCFVERKIKVDCVDTLR